MSNIVRALFLDRDGIINVDAGYVHTVEDFVFIDGIFSLVACAGRYGFRVVVVTNQAGIGRGYYTEAQFHALTDWMKQQFVQHNAVIDAVYFCPYHPECGVGEYKQDSFMRKPNPGMLLAAAEDMGIELSQSIMLGDSLKDMQAGHAAGVRNLFLYGGAPGTFYKSITDYREIERFIAEETSYN